MGISSVKRELINRGINGDKISVILNGVDLSKYKPIICKDKTFAKQYDLNNKIVIGYIGTHGLAHGLEHIIMAAEKLKQEPKLVFLFVGSGAVKQKRVMLVKLHCEWLYRLLSQPTRLSRQINLVKYIMLYLTGKL